MDRANARRAPRVATFLPATVIDSGGAQFPVTVTDLSSGGFRMDCSEPLVPGEKIHLRVARYGDYPAEIEWANQSEAGGRFLETVKLVDDIPT